MELFRLLGVLAIDTDEARRSLEETRRSAEETGEGTNSAFERIGTAASKVGKMAIGAGAALGGAWIAAIESTREYRTEMGKLDTAFVTNGHSSETAKQTYSELNSILGDSGQATEAAQHLAMLTDNEKDLQTWTDICTGVYAKFGESIPIESLTESANEVAKSGELTGGLVDALVWAGIGEEEFQGKLDACSSEQERQKLIMDTLNGTYKEAADQYKETNKDVIEAEKAQERLTDAFAEVGAVGEPIMTAVKNAIASMVLAAVPLIESMIVKVKDMRKWMQDNKSTVEAWKAVIIGAAAAIGTFVVAMKIAGIMSSAASAIRKVRSAMLLLNVAMSLNPIGIVISLIAGLVAAFIYLWNNNKAFREFWIGLWNKIKDVCGVAIRWIKVKFSELKAASKTVKETFDRIKKDITEKIDGAKEAVKNAIDKIKGFFNFTWKLPSLKLPKISVTGKFSLDPPSIPKFGLKWNAEGGVLTKPTIFGMTGQTLLGGGEAGKEAIAPITVLQEYIKSAVQGENEGIIRTLIEQNRILMDYLARIVPSVVQLDSGAIVGELTPAIDVKLSDVWNHSLRGNTR